MTTSNNRKLNGYVSKGGYDSYEPDDNYQPSPSHPDSNNKAFNVRVHVNKDTKTPGKKVLVQTNKLKNLNNFLDECRKKTDPPFGAPRRIYTPSGGRQVFFLDDLTADGVYVITGAEKFRRFPYKDIPERTRIARLPPKGYKKIDINKYIPPVTHPWDQRLRNKSGRCQALNENNHGLTLRVHIEDHDTGGARVVHILPRHRTNVKKITETIEDELKLPCRIDRLYEIINEGGKRENFKELWRRPPNDHVDHSKDTIELERNLHILVTSKKELDVKKMYRLQGAERFKMSPRAGEFRHHDSPNTPYKYGKPLPGIKSNTMSPMSNVSHGSYGGRSQHRRRNQRPAQQVNYDREDGVFRAKNARHTQDARQVNDTKDTRVERPIDEMEAEIVKEEDIHHKEKTTPIPPGTELNKQPSLEQKQNADTGIQTKQKEVKKGKQKKDAQKVPVKGLVIVDEKEDNKDKKQATDKPKPNNKPVEDSNKTDTVDVSDDRDKAKTPNDTKTTKVEPNKTPESKAHPNLDGNTENAKQSQERVNGDQGSHRIDEYEEDSFNNTDRNASQPLDPPRSSTPASRGEARRKEKQQRDEAAAKIQAGFRGRKVRQEYSEKKRQNQEARKRDEEAERDRRMRFDEEENRKKEKAASVIQASYKGHKVRKDMSEKKVCENDENNRAHNAASKIQSGFKGYKVRKQYASKRGQKNDVKDVNDNEKKDENNDGEMRDKAATKIQSGFKGYITRKKYNATKAEKIAERKQTQENAEKAATKIQAGFKGYKVRKSVADKKATKETQPVVEKKEDEAASRIQANFRGFKGRQQYAEMKKEKKEHAAASKIQATFKGYKTRKSLSEKKKESQLPDPSDTAKAKPTDTDLDKAAAKIQSGYRGYKVRKEYKAKVIEDGDVDSDVDQLPESAIARQLLKKSQFALGIMDDVASKLQVSYRAYHFRKIFYDGYEETVLQKGNHIEAKIKSAFGGYVTRKHAREEKYNQDELHFRTMAATKIQAHYRGYKVRHTKKYQIRQINKLQAAFRAHITRKLNHTTGLAKVLGVEGSDYYATLIQSLCRGYMTRNSITAHTARSPVKSAHSLQGPTKSSENISYWEDSHIKMYSDKSLRLAATRIQCAYRMYIVRCSYVLIKEKIQYSQTQAAVRIQAHYRGYMVRKGLKNEYRVEELDDLEEKHDSEEELSKLMYDEQGHICESGREKQENGVQEIGIVSKDISQSRPSTGRREVSNQSLEEKLSSPRPSTGRGSRGSRRNTFDDQTFEAVPLKLRPSTCKQRGPIHKACDDEHVEAKLSRPSTGRTGRESRGSGILPDSPVRSAKKRNHAGKVKFPDQVNNEFSKSVDDRISVSDIGKEGTLDSLETVNTLSTVPGKDIEKNSSGEIEKEGESPREIEDDAGELDVMKKNANAVSQVQAAFRAYKLRREVSELLGGGGELMDIRKVDRAVSALRRDFKLRSAKVRRLASYQFSKGSPSGKSLLNLDDIEDVAKALAAQTVQDAFRSYHYRKEQKTDFSDTYGIDKHTPCENFIEPMNEQPQTDDEMAVDSANVRKAKQVLKIEAAYRGYRTRQTERNLKLKEEPAPYSNQDFRKENKSKEAQANATLLIRAAYSGYHARKNVKAERQRQSAAAKIKASFDGYRVRKTEYQIRNKSDTELRAPNTVNYHVEMLSKVVNNRATQLQAAFAGYQTRKVFISLTKLVEQDQPNDASVSGNNLKRMGSLSETDDFKLRHKSIAKIQALEAERNGGNIQELTSVQNKASSLQSSSNEKFRLPLIQLHTVNVSLRPKSGTFTANRSFQSIGGKSKTQPEMHCGSQRMSSNETLHGIEIFIKKKIAATIIQSCAKGFLMREAQRIKLKASSNESENRSLSRKSDRPTSKVSFASKETEEKCKPTKLSEEIRARTASIKLEAERRKIIAQRVQQKKAKAALEAEKSSNNHSQSSEGRTNGEQVKDFEERKDGKPDKDINISSVLTPIMSERIVKESDLKQRENSSAIMIQKVYRGYSQRKKLKKQLQGTAELEHEYEEWKQKRIQAAVAIQSSWRGYVVRKELQNEQDDQENMVQDKFWSNDSPPGILVINIGRTKSEIERANKQYENCSMIQMVVRASKMRRKLQVKLAIRRSRKTDTVDKIHAVFRGYKNRRERKRMVSAVSIQTVMKGFLARDRMQHRALLKEEEQHEAATHLQAASRAFVKRTDNVAAKEARRKLAEANQAAVFIQSAYRGHSVREGLGERKEEMRREAAGKIEAGILGLKARVKIFEKKKAIVRLIAGYRSYRRRLELRLYKEKLEHERVASTRMQSAFRSYKRRVKRRLYVEKMERERVAATQIQAAYRSYGTRCEMRKYKKRVAATRIQAGFRSYETRCEMRKYKEKRERQNKAAMVIQSSARGRLARIEFQLLKELNCRRAEATLKIQSVYRGYKDRLSVKKLRHVVEVNNAAKDIIEILIDRSADYLRRRSSSAERIQATMKGHKTRSRMDLERRARNEQRNRCSTQIQAVIRAEQGRAMIEEMRVLAYKNAAAMKIQSLYRGYATRKELARERSIIAEIEPPFISARTRSGRLLALSLDDVLMKNARAMILFHKKASELQAAFRARRARQGVNDRLFVKHQIIEMTPRRETTGKFLSREDKAAVLIQKIWRGYSDRKAYKILLTSKRRIWNASASIIQAAVAGYERRKEERQRRERLKRESVDEIVKEKMQTADIISYAYRALKRRREKLALRAEM